MNHQPIADQLSCNRLGIDRRSFVQSFAADLRDDEKADAFLEANELTPGKFLCCIPRLRYTPYWKIKNQPFNQERHDRNEAMKEHDHAPLRAVIRAVTDQGDYKVKVLCDATSVWAIGCSTWTKRMKLSESSQRFCRW